MQAQARGPFIPLSAPSVSCTHTAGISPRASRSSAGSASPYFRRLASDQNSTAHVRGLCASRCKQDCSLHVSTSRPHTISSPTKAALQERGVSLTSFLCSFLVRFGTAGRRLDHLSRIAGRRATSPDEILLAWQRTSRCGIRHSGIAKRPSGEG